MTILFCAVGCLNNDRSHKQVSLVFFSTFEPISLTPDSCMQRKGVPMLYERAANQVPTLYVCPVENVLGRVPLLPCYLKGNTVNTIPHSCGSQIPRGAAQLLLLIPGLTTGQGAGCLRLTSGCGRMEGLFRASTLWPGGKLWHCEKKRVQESRARGAATLQRRREAAASKMGVQGQ